MYPVTREGLFPQKAEVALKQALIELKEQCGNQEKHNQSLKDKNILQGFEKDLPGDRKVNISEFYKTLGIDTKNAITYYYKKGNDNLVQVDYREPISDFTEPLKKVSNHTYVYYHR